MSRITTGRSYRRRPARTGSSSTRSITLAFSFIVTMIIGKAIDATIGLRVTEAEELSGLDVTLHAESGYNLDHA